MSLSLLIFLGGYCFLLLRAFVSRPIFGLYAYLFAFYAHPVSRWWGYSLPEFRWSFVAALVTLLAIFIKTDKKDLIWFKFKETKLFLFFTIFVIAQCVWALNIDVHMIYVMLVIKFLILIFLIQNSIKKSKDAVGFIIANLLGCAYFGYLATSAGGGRLEGIGGPGIEAANQLAQHLAVVLFFSAYLLFFKLGWKILLLIPLILINLNTIMLTESRGAIVAIVITGIFSLFYMPPKYKKQFLFLVTLGAISFSVLLGPQIVERFTSLEQDSSGELNDKSAQSRFVIINAQIEMFKESPILGYGHRSTLLLSPFYIDATYRTNSSKGSDGEARRASHNFIMGLLVDHGLVGAVLYGVIIFLCLKRLIILRKLKTVVFTEEGEKLKLLLTGFTLGLLCFMISGLASNHKVNEIDIWLYSIIPLLYHLLLKNMEEKNVS
ncbi:O-antigen ligase family protein [Thalassotalea sp. SU-HH00458]|uniref:O-antigen ligase family protein n=1 Tax=Thalassotalea sp. SU-HH00458 TaxID=3127657 RepID=UPI003107B454